MASSLTKMFVTLAAAAGLPNLKEELLTGYKNGRQTYKVHLDGYNQLDYWTGKTEKSARREFFYYDETDLMAIRDDDWKMHIGVKTKAVGGMPRYYPAFPTSSTCSWTPWRRWIPYHMSGATSAVSSLPRRCGHRPQPRRSWARI